MAIFLPAGSRLMLWRRGYQSRVREDLPDIGVVGVSLAGERWEPGWQGLVVGCFDPEGLRQMELWRRLVLGDFGKPSWLRFALFGEFPLVEELVPRSRHASTFLCETGRWPEATGDIRRDEAFGAILRTEVIELLVVGAVTEEAWDQVSAALLRLATPNES